MRTLTPLPKVPSGEFTNISLEKYVIVTDLHGTSHSQIAEIVFDGHRYSGKLDISRDEPWLKTYSSKFTPTDLPNTPDLLGSEVKLFIPGEEITATCAVIGVRRSNQEIVEFITLNVTSQHKQPTPDAQQISFRWMELEVHNFVRWQGEIVGFQEGKTRQLYPGRITLHFGKWTVFLESTRESNTRSKYSSDPNLASTTHHAIVYRNLESGKPRLISVDQATDLIDFLEILLTIYAGRLVSVGYGRGRTTDTTKPIWRDLRPKWDSRWHHASNWLPSDGAPNAKDLAARLWGMWNDHESFRSALKIIANYYSSSMDPQAGPELGVVSALSGLEIVTWHLFVDRLRILDKKSYENLGNTEKLRFLLVQCCFPIELPSTLTEKLKKTFNNKQKQGLDGPAAVVHFRNAIVHPGGDNGKWLTSLSRQEKYILRLIATQYFEISLLYILGYGGPYNDRIRGNNGKLWSITPWSNSSQ